MGAPKFDGVEAQVSRQGHGIEPELGRLGIAIQMDVRWLIRFVTLEVHPVGTDHQDGGHVLSMSLIFRSGWICLEPSDSRMDDRP